MPTLTARALCATVFAVLLCPSAWSADTVVYRCLDARLSIVYTDVPCKEGAAFDIRYGDPDPAALASLERARDALDQSAAQRISEERRLAGQKELMAMARRMSEEESHPSNEPYAYGMVGYGWSGFLPIAPSRPLQHRPPRPSTRPGFAPTPPYIVPRP